MAFMCVRHPNRECDGCGECEENQIDEGNEEEQDGE
jgi:hypothetical protein